MTEALAAAVADEPTRKKVLSSVRKHAATSGIVGTGLVVAVFLLQDKVAAAAADAMRARELAAETKVETRNAADKLEGRLERLENKLDRVIERLGK